MIGMAVLGLMLVFFFVVAYFAARTWHVGHVVALGALFVFTLVFFILASATLKTHERWRKAYERDKQALAQAIQTQTRLQFGDAANAEDEDSLRGVTELAKNQQLNRGRVWRNLVLTPDPNAITLNTSGWTNDNCLKVGQEAEDVEAIPEPLPDEGVAAENEGGPAVAGGGPTHGITENTFVYAFKEYPISTLTPAEKAYYFGKLETGEVNFADQDTRGLCRVPLAYMGKFRVAGVTEQSVSLAWTTPPDDGQRQLLGDRGTWVLYEQLPRDSHGLFQGLNPQELQALFPANRMQQMGLNLPPPAYDEMIRRYVRDYQQAQPTDPPERKWVEVKFNKPYKVAVDLEVEGETPPADRPFAAGGRAQVPQLMQKSPTEFAPGDTAVLDYLTASQLIGDEFAERVREIYVRDLRDYQLLFDEAHADMLKLMDGIKVAQGDLNGLQKATEQLNAQGEKYRQEGVLLRQDLAGYQQELEQLSAYRDTLKSRFDYLRSEINRLYMSQATPPPERTVSAR